MTAPHRDPVQQATHANASAQQEFGDFFLFRFLDLEITYDDEAQTSSVTLPYAPYLCNPQGSVHGGVIATVADISMGHLCHRFLSTAVTIEMQLRFFRPLSGTGVFTGRFLRPGRKVIHLESKLTGEDGKVAAVASGSWHRLEAAS